MSMMRDFAGLEPGVILVLPRVMELADLNTDVEDMESILTTRDMVYESCAKAAIRACVEGGILNRRRG